MTTDTELATEWEPFDPCPDCGTEEFHELVKAHGTSRAQDGEKTSFELRHIGQAMVVECANCNLTLLDRTKEETPR